MNVLIHVKSELDRKETEEFKKKLAEYLEAPHILIDIGDQRKIQQFFNTPISGKTFILITDSLLLQFSDVYKNYFQYSYPYPINIVRIEIISDKEVKINKNTFKNYSHEEIFEIIKKEAFPKVVVIGRFQPLHKGHEIIFDLAFSYSPIVDVYIRREKTDFFPLEVVKEMIETLYPEVNNIIETPPIEYDNGENFIENIKQNFLKEKYKYLIQGNPDVLKYLYKRFKPKGFDVKSLQEKYNIDLPEVIFVPRYSNISGTKIREQLQKGKIEEIKKVVDKKVLNVISRYFKNQF